MPVTGRLDEAALAPVARARRDYAVARGRRANGLSRCEIAHEPNETLLPATLHALCGKDLADLFKAGLYVVIDKHIIINITKILIPIVSFWLIVKIAVRC